MEYHPPPREKAYFDFLQGYHKLILVFDRENANMTIVIILGSGTSVPRIQRRSCSALVKTQVSDLF
jgi:hypothetical protein